MSTYFRRTITNTSVASTLLWAPEDVQIPTMDGQNPLKQRLIHLLNYHFGTPTWCAVDIQFAQSFPETFQPTHRPENSSSKPYLQHAFGVSGFVSREIQWLPITWHTLWYVRSHSDCWNILIFNRVHTSTQSGSSHSSQLCDRWSRFV